MASEKSQSWHAWVEPWFLSYAFLGISVAGLAPIILPLSVGKSGSVTEIGLVVGAFNLGGLSAPLWGGIADRHGFHKVLLISGLLVTFLALAVFPLSSSLAIRIALALGQGVGAASAATVANLFIVETHPQVEWDERIGWLQTFYGGGQVIGLLLAGVVSSLDIRFGFFIAAGITLMACLPALFMKSAPRPVRISRPLLKHPSRHIEFIAGSPQSFYHHLNIKALKHLAHSLVSPLGLFLFAWFVSFGGVAAFFSLYPVLMNHVYGVNPSISSVGFAVAATAALFLYAPSGKWSKKIGAMNVLRTGLIIRIFAFLVLFVIGIISLEINGPMALVAFGLAVIAWSLLSVAGTEITAQFSAEHEGEGLGLFNASTAVAGVAGAVIGGWSAGIWGYTIVPVLGICGAVIGLLLTVIIRK
jgi:MFS family permease